MRVVSALCVAVFVASSLACCCVGPPGLTTAKAQPERPKQPTGEAVPQRLELPWNKETQTQANRPLAGVSRENYNKIKEGMTIDEVQAILGPGKEGARSGPILTATWQDGGVIISITFQSNRVKAKAIIGG